MEMMINGFSMLKHITRVSLEKQKNVLSVKHLQKTINLYKFNILYIFDRAIVYIFDKRYKNRNKKYF